MIDAIAVARAAVAVVGDVQGERIAGALRDALSPRHAPDTIVALPAIPHTLTGKKLELPVKRILAGTPAGEVATTAHWGDYSQMHGAYAALERWCAANRRKVAGVTWEVYGDWHDDPAQVRTDVYFLLQG